MAVVALRKTVGKLEILLVSTYELGHQPLALASPLAYLARAGYAPVAVDTSMRRTWAPTAVALGVMLTAALVMGWSKST